MCGYAVSLHIRYKICPSCSGYAVRLSIFSFLYPSERGSVITIKLDLSLTGGLLLLQLASLSQTVCSLGRNPGEGKSNKVDSELLRILSMLVYF